MAQKGCSFSTKIFESPFSAEADYNQVEPWL